MLLLLFAGAFFLTSAAAPTSFAGFTTHDAGVDITLAANGAFGALCAGCNPLLTFALSLAPALTYESESAPHAQLLEVRGEGRVVGQAVRGRAGAGRRRMEGPFKMGDDKTRCAYCISGDEDSVHCAVCTSV